MKATATRRDIERIMEPIVEREVRKGLQALKNANSRSFGEMMFSEPVRRRAAENDVGIAVGAILRGFALSGGNPQTAIRVAENLGVGSDVQVATETGPAYFDVTGGAVEKALAAGDLTAGGVMIVGDLANEVIELLRPMSAVRRMTPRIIQVPRGTKTFPKITQSASAAYVEENSDIASSEPKFGEIVMTARKLAAMVPISNELLSFSSMDAEREIRDDLIEEIAKVEDENLLRSDGTQSAPIGLRFATNASNITASNGTTTDNIEQDFADLIEDLEGNNVRMVRPHWVMASRSKNHLLNLRDSNGNLIYPELRNSTPTIYTWPVIISNNIPNNLGGGGNETEIYFADGNEIYLGEVEGIRVEVTREGSYRDGSNNLQSAWSRDQTVLRVILQHDLALRHDVGVAIKTAVTWGA